MMPRRTTLPFFALCVALLPAPANADEVRLHDGRVLVGKVAEKGDTLEITTRDGVVVVARQSVRSHRRDEELRAELNQLAKDAGDTAFAHLHLAIQARNYGLDAELWRHLDRTVLRQRESARAAGADPAKASTHASLQRRLEDFLAQLQPEVLPRKWRTADTRARCHQLLDQLRAETGPGKRAAIEELLVREPNADQDLRTEARRNGDSGRRIGALAALLRRQSPGNDNFVLRTTVLDGSSEVRDAAAALYVDRGLVDTAAVHYLAPGLMHGNGKVRMRTAEAFAAMGHPDAVKLLVLAGPNAGVALASADQGVRGHVAFLNQQAYIRDFDVEVASAAFIADPKIDTLISGSVLDVTVVGVFEEVHIVRAYQQALKRLTNSDPGKDPRSWAGWLAALPATAPQAPATGRR
jgi:hypothetical protein